MILKWNFRWYDVFYPFIINHLRTKNEMNLFQSDCWQQTQFYFWWSFYNCLCFPPWILDNSSKAALKCNNVSKRSNQNDYYNVNIYYWKHVTASKQTYKWTNTTIHDVQGRTCIYQSAANWHDQVHTGKYN